MGSPNILGIPGSTVCRIPTGVVSAIVTDDSPIASAAPRWSPSGGDELTTPMAGSGSVYSTTIGPFVVSGSLTATIVATDIRGNSQTEQVRSSWSHVRKAIRAYWLNRAKALEASEVIGPECPNTAI